MTEIKSSFRPSVDDIYAFILSAVLISAAFIAFYKNYALGTAAITVTGSILILLAREVGQRSVAQWMDAYVELEISEEGAVITFFGVIITALTSIPLLLLFPLQSEFSGRKYEHWGKSIDAIWAKRQYWLVTGGITGLMIFYLLSAILGFTQIAQMTSYFAIMQMLPFDFWGIPTGELDGAYILRWSGFTWLILMGLNLFFLGLTLV
ncbi:MAG: hypothetical protein ACI977_000324 [Candidatus Nanohaloarchaea archaeon]